MDRAAWLRERRAAVEADYDRDAPTYDLDPYPIEVHRRFVDRLVATCPPGGLILDAPCGTGDLHNGPLRRSNFEKVLKVSLHTGFLTDFFVARLAS